MKKYTLFLLALFFPVLLSAQTVLIPDTTVQRGAVFPVNIAVEGIPEGQTISLHIEYEADLLYYVRAEGGGDRIMQCAEPAVSNSLEGTEGTLVVTCSNVRPAGTGILFTLYFEALAGPDSVTGIQSSGLTVNNTEVMGVAYDVGVVRIPGEPVFPQPTESLSQNYPNPFGFFTTFNYTVADDVEVDFRVFSLAGRHVAEDDYIIVVQPEQSTVSIAPGFNMANGAYLMQMKTENGVYQVPFFFIR